MALKIRWQQQDADRAKAGDGWGDTGLVLLSELDRPADALPIAEEAAAIYRGLATANLDQYRLVLAHSLAALATIRQKLCQTADADSMHAEVAQVTGTDS